jgi:hypothetical protein
MLLRWFIHHAGRPSAEGDPWLPSCPEAGKVAPPSVPAVQHGD